MPSNVANFLYSRMQNEAMELNSPGDAPMERMPWLGHQGPLSRAAERGQVRKKSPPLAWDLKAVNPPSITMLLPVMKADLSLARKSASSAMSSG